MKKIEKNRIMISSIIAIIIIAGILCTYFLRLNYTLEYGAHTRIDLYIGKEYQMNDIRDITKEVFGKEKVLFREIEQFKDTVAIIVKTANEEQITKLKEKVKEKYVLESTDEVLETTNVPNMRGRDIVKPYIVPTIILTAILLGYLGVRYFRLGAIKVILELLLKLVIVEAIFISIIAITRLPIGSYTMPMAIALYILTVVQSNAKMDKRLTIVEREDNQQ